MPDMPDMPGPAGAHARNESIKDLFGAVRAGAVAYRGGCCMVTAMPFIVRSGWAGYERTAALDAAWLERCIVRIASGVLA